MHSTEKTHQDDTDMALTRLDRLIYLYEGAIDFLKRSVEAGDAGQGLEFAELLNKGRSIIETFKKTLDFDQGGEVAQQLSDLYDFMLDNLAAAEKSNDTQPVNKVIHNLNILLDGWRGAHPQIAAESKL